MKHHSTAAWELARKKDPARCLRVIHYLATTGQTSSIDDLEDMLSKNKDGSSTGTVCSFMERCGLVDYVAGAGTSRLGNPASGIKLTGRGVLLYMMPAPSQVAIIEHLLSEHTAAKSDRAARRKALVDIQWEIDTQSTLQRRVDQMLSGLPVT